MSDDQVRRSFVALQALRDNAPAYPNAEYVAQYHSELDRLEGVGYETKDWRIPPDWVVPRLISRGGYSGKEVWSLPQIQQYQLFAKLDAVLGFFALGDRPIGFEGPHRKS